MLYEVVKAKSGLYWRPQEAGDGRVVGCLPQLVRRVTYRGGASSRERSVLQLAMLEGWGQLSPVTSDMVYQSLELALLGFSLALVIVFPHCVPATPFLGC